MVPYPCANSQEFVLQPNVRASSTWLWHDVNCNVLETLIKQMALRNWKRMMFSLGTSTGLLVVRQVKKRTLLFQFAGVANIVLWQL